MKNEATQAEKNYLEKDKKFKCDFCEKILSSLKDYQKYVYEKYSV